MTRRRTKTDLGRLADVVLLAISLLSFVTIVSFVSIDLMRWSGLTPDYTYAEFEDIEPSKYVFACGVLLPIILVMLPKLRRRR